MKINPDLKYPLNNPDGKVSIRYYLNTRLKPEILEDGKEVYPLYFQLIVKRQKSLTKSYVENNKMSVADFEKIKDVANATKLEDIDKGLMPLLSNNLSENEKEDNILDLAFPILKEKNLIYNIVADLKPFDRSNFDIKDFSTNFEIYNVEIKQTLSKAFRDIMKVLLEKEIKQENLILADSFLKAIDWNKADAYHLWFVLKDKFEQVNSIMKAFPYCFQIASGVNVNNLSENDIWIIDFFGKQTYYALELGLKSAYEMGLDGQKLMFGNDNPLFNTISTELKTFFFSK